MARDPIGALLKVRLHAVAQARSVLAACLSAEAAIADRIGALDEAARRDRSASSGWTDAHRFVEMSASRLAAVQAGRRRAKADLAAAEARSAEARSAVAAARTAAEAVEQLIAERRAASQAEADRREQHALDDIARARFAGRQRAEAGSSDVRPAAWPGGYGEPGGPGEPPPG